MNLGELNKEMFHFLEGCEILEDNDGQIVIYTGLMRDPDDNGFDPKLVDFDNTEKE